MGESFVIDEMNITSAIAIGTHSFNPTSLHWDNRLLRTQQICLNIDRLFLHKCVVEKHSFDRTAANIYIYKLYSLHLNSH